MSGRIRTIKPEVLDDEKAAGLSDAAWRMWVSLWVLADDYGNVRMGDRYLASSVWQDSSRDADTPRAELAAEGMVCLYAVRGQRYGHINGFTKNQRVDNAGKARVPSPDQDDGSWDGQRRQPLLLPPAPTSNQQLARDLADFPANNSEPSDGRRSRVAGARIPAAGPPTSDLRPPTSDPEGDPLPAEGGEGTSPPEDRAPRASMVDLVVGASPSPRPFDRGTANAEMADWEEIYRACVRKMTGVCGNCRPVTIRKFTQRDKDALLHAVETICPDRSKRFEWLAESVEAFVRGVHGTPKFWSDYMPEGLVSWFTNGQKLPASGIHRAGTPRNVQQPPPVKHYQPGGAASKYRLTDEQAAVAPPPKAGGTGGRA